MSRDRPTILQIIPELDTGGAELSTLEIADAVVKAGGRAIVLSEGGRLAGRLTLNDAEFVPFPAKTKNPLSIVLNARRILALIRAEGVDLVHARSRAPAWSAHWAARAAGIPFVTTYHGIYREGSALKKAYNRIMARGDIVIANSGYTGEIIAQRYDLPPERLTIIHRGVDTQSFDPDRVSHARKDALARSWGIVPGHPIILQAARLSRWKGQEILIQAVRALQKERPQHAALVVLAGSDQGRHDYRALLEARIREAGLGETVRLVGHVEDMPAAFALAHATVVASVEPEAFGRTAIEAQAMGCPVIATDHGAPRETVVTAPPREKQERTGWLVAPGSSDELAAALGEALALGAEERAAMGARARANVEQNFTLEAMRLKTLGVYDRLLGTGLVAGYRARHVSRHPQSGNDPGL